MNNSEMINILIILLVFMLVVLFVFIFILLILRAKNKRQEKEKMEISENTKKNNTKKVHSSESKSVKDFMEFYDIKDDMIIKKEKQKYLMVLGCQGINYDLMSTVEKNAVEEGFIQFLNSLTMPIQLYIQTRKVNLTYSIEEYKSNLKSIEDRYMRLQYEYNQYRKDPNVEQQQLKKYNFELVKQRNLYEYTKDIIQNTENMSLNKNILNKNYYVVISYSPEGEEKDLYESEEITDLAFSELYTKSQAIARVLNVCGVTSKVLNSMELSELLYVAYNRDDFETFGMDRAVEAEYDNLYVTSKKVIDKKIETLNQTIEKEAYQLANNISADVKLKSEKQKQFEEKEKNMKDIIKEMAKTIIEENFSELTEEEKKKAIKEIENKGKEKKDGKKGVGEKKSK